MMTKTIESQYQPDEKGSMEQKLIVFLKFPEKGKVKTRLARSMGDEEAACVYKKLAEDTVNAVRPLAGKSVDVVIAYDPPEKETEIRKWIHGPFQFISQGTGSLGDRLSRTTYAAFQGRHAPGTQTEMAL